MAKRTNNDSDFKPSTTNNDNFNKVKVSSNSHAVQIDADYAIWDTTTNAFVKPEDTNFNANK